MFLLQGAYLAEQAEKKVAQSSTMFMVSITLFPVLLCSICKFSFWHTSTLAHQRFIINESFWVLQKSMSSVFIHIYLGRKQGFLTWIWKRAKYLFQTRNRDNTVKFFTDFSTTDLNNRFLLIKYYNIFSPLGI